MSRTIQRFVVLDELGRGGMGVVVRAKDPRLDREVAIKLIELAGEPPEVLSANATIDLRARPTIENDVLSEARMMARLSHPNVLPIYEVGLDGSAVFLVMEYIAGENLRGWLEREHTAEDKLALLEQAANGLAAAHASGIVHRDFKPDNVLIGGDGRVRVCDFGLANLTTALVADDATRGTPRYMAPELFDGKPATKSSDVFALCRTIAEAFGGADDPAAATLPPALRAVVLAGLDDDPAKRPSLDAVIAELRRSPDPPRAKRRWPWLAGALGCAALAALAIATTRGGGSACEIDRVLDGIWDAPARDTVVRAAAPGPARDRMLATIDGYADSILELRRDACEAHQRGELGASEAAIRASCLERRAIELGIFVRHGLARSPFDAARLDDDVYQGAQPASCTEETAPPIRVDRAALTRLWEPLFDRADRDPAHALALVAAARDAGEAELAIRGQLRLGGLYQAAGKLDEADRVYDAAYRDAVALASPQYEAIVLNRRILLAGELAQPIAAESYAKLALALADRPSLHPITRVRVYAMVAFSAERRGEYAKALPLVRTARELIAKIGRPVDDVEGQLRLTQFAATIDTEGATPATIALAHDNLEWTRAHYGEHAEYAGALADVASALEQSGDVAAALSEYERAAAMLTKELGATAGDTIRARMLVGDALVALRGLDDGKRELAAALADSERNQAAHAHRPMIESYLGVATFMLGQYDEGIRLMERAVDEMTSELGGDHARTLYGRSRLIGSLVEVGRLDEAEHQVAAVQEAARGENPVAAYVLGMQEPQLLRARGKLKEAEQRARAALAATEETKRPEAERADMLWSLGAILADEQQWSEARELLEQDLAILERKHAAPDDLAEAQVPLALALLHTGDRARAKELAATAQAALDKFPSHVRARAQLAKLSAQLR